MAKVIAIAGKGGVGKTTIAALMIDFLASKGVVLAVDADPSANLNQALGMPLADTVGNIREHLDKQLREGTFSAGVTKKDFLNLKVREALVETKKVDLLVMGRPEGPGCYCAVNNMLRSIIDHIKDGYDYVVVDCEAGMEHISRQTTHNVDYLVIVSEPTARSLNAASGIKVLISDLRTSTGKVSLVINRVAKELPKKVWDRVEKLGLEPVITIREDGGLYDLEIDGRPVVELPAEAPVRKGVLQLASDLGL